MVDSAPHVKRGHPIFMGLILFFAIIEGSLTSWLVSQYNMSNNYPSGSIRDRSRFLVFTSWWTVVLSAAYMAVFIINPSSILASVASHAVFIGLTWLFWMSGAASWTAALSGGINCSTSNVLYCNQLVATEAFAWIEFILFSTLLILFLVIGTSSVRRGDGFAGALV